MSTGLLAPPITPALQVDAALRARRSVGMVPTNVPVPIAGSRMRGVMVRMSGAIAAQIARANHTGV